MVTYRQINICLLLFLISGLTTAQTLRGLDENPLIKTYRQSGPVISEKSTPYNTLPFFEDFSTSGIFPDQGKWADNYVFINNSFPVDPISSGVATFDAVDSKGDLYASGDMPVPSDRLTITSFQPFTVFCRKYNRNAELLFSGCR
jgi:hypothetical protein